MKNNTRYHNIDLMEFWGILFVIIYHGHLTSGNFLEGHTAIRQLNYVLKTILSSCVPIFFFCNGYLLFNKPFDLKKHIMKTIRLIFLTGIWGGITILILMPIKHEYMTFSTFVKALWNWKTGWINHLWFMGALICIYLIFPLLKVVFDNNKKYFIYFIVICTVMTFGNTLLNMLFSLHQPITERNFFNIFNPFRGIHAYTFVYFCVGGLLCYYQNLIRDALNKYRAINLITILTLIISWILLSGYGIFVSYKTGQPYDIVWNGYDTVFTLIIVIAIYVLSSNYKPLDNSSISRFIRFVSCNTIGIFFIHRILIFLTKNAVLNICTSDIIIFDIIYAVIIMCTSLLIIAGLKKIPVIKKLV